MSQAVTPEARWDAMTSKEKVSWIAKEFMGWHWRQYGIVMSIGGWHDAEGNLMWDRELNELDDWNIWRLVELKVMEDERLMWNFFAFFDADAASYCLNDLPTRARALYIAHHSLHANP